MKPPVAPKRPHERVRHGDAVQDPYYWLIDREDPEALAMAQAVIGLIMRSAGDKGDFEVIRLQNASATEAAKVLDETFNGPKQPAQPAMGMNPFLARFAGMGAMPPPTPARATTGSWRRRPPTWTRWPGASRRCCAPTTW